MHTYFPTLFLPPFPRIQPGTFHNFRFEVTVPQFLKICKMEIEHIGDNFPCHEALPDTEKDETVIENRQFRVQRGRHACFRSRTNRSSST